MSDDRAVVVLIGAPGAGKTRTGKRLARALDVPFIDTDRVIVEEHGAITEIFAAHGEAHFRAIERDAVTRSLRERAVVALGGGAVLDADTQADLEGLRVVQLTVSPDAVSDRIANGKRPLLTGGIEAWKALVASRQEVYDRVSQRTFDTSHQPLEAIARQIVSWLKKESE